MRSAAPIQFNAKGQVEGNLLGRDPEPQRQAGGGRCRSGGAKRKPVFADAP